MYIQKTSFDDILREVLRNLLQHGERVKTTRGFTKELCGIALELENPLARLSLTESRGKIFSCLGELFWYLSGTSALKFIQYYIRQYVHDSEDGSTIHGAYGPRLFDANGINQIENIIQLLRKKPRSRRAVIQIFSAADIARERKEIPCTSTLQFLMPDNKLSLVVNMRSNDALYGLPHDVFAFTMLQEIVARTLDVEIGKYVHFVGSMHLYENKAAEARAYIREGFQDIELCMPPMPNGDPWAAIHTLQKAEELARSERRILEDVKALHPYWQDLAKMFLVFAASKNHDEIALRALSVEMHDPIYAQYIQARIDIESTRSNYQGLLDL